MGKITKLEACKNADAAEKVLTDLTNKRDSEISKVNEKYSEQILNAERNKRLADGVLLKLVQPKTPTVKKPVVRRVQQEG